MGPVLIFDKSVLHSLNPDESVWLDQFFMCNITPLFFMETLADLEKEVRAGRKAEEVVGNLAYKTPELHSSRNSHHRTLLAAELEGQVKIDLKIGRPHIGGGQRSELPGQTGVVFTPTPEEEAFQRWQRREFLDLERTLAKKWREELALINLEKRGDWYRQLLAIEEKPKSLEEVKRFVDRFLDEEDQARALIVGMSIMGVREDAQKRVLERWNAAGRTSLKEFAPYLRYLAGVECIFYLGVSGGFVTHRKSNTVDLAYLYYLPFCVVFSSNDRLHESLVPLIMRSDQSFISGKAMKEDLGHLDQHYDELPEETKSQGLYSLAPHPPKQGDFLAAQLWDKHLPGWRKNEDRQRRRSKDAEKKMVEEIKAAVDAAHPEDRDAEDSAAGTDFLIIERHVAMQRGKWKRFPPEVKPEKR